MKVQLNKTVYSSGCMQVTKLIQNMQYIPDTEQVIIHFKRTQNIEGHCQWRHLRA